MSGSRIRRKRIDGVLLLDKPQGLTSNSALQKARRCFEAAKAGHTGTLDPMATGLLPLCFGEATKFSSELLNADKTYEATVRLGIRTDTGDLEGKILEIRLPGEIDQERLESVLESFRGRIEQVPPMHSALKHQGRPLYDYARKGIEIDRPRREVVIHSLTLHQWSLEWLEIAVRCSKGTYIRTLAEDIGEALGCGACLERLRRTQIGALQLHDAVGLETLESLSVMQRNARLLPVEALLMELPAWSLDAQTAQRFLCGRKIPVEHNFPPQRWRVYGPQDRFLGLAEFENDCLVPRRLMAQPESMGGLDD